MKFLTKVAIFCCFDVFSLRPPHIFQVQAKISTVRPAFPDCISVSSDCDERYTEQGRQHNIEEIGLSKGSLKTADAINQVFSVYKCFLEVPKYQLTCFYTHLFKIGYERSPIISKPRRCVPKHYTSYDMKFVLSHLKAQKMCAEAVIAYAQPSPRTQVRRTGICSWSDQEMCNKAIRIRLTSIFLS